MFGSPSAQVNTPAGLMTVTVPPGVQVGQQVQFQVPSSVHAHANRGTYVLSPDPDGLSPTQSTDRKESAISSSCRCQCQ